MESEQKTKLIENMVRVRLGQIIINEKIKNNEFKIPIHLAMGHEAIAIAVDSIMTESDQLVLSHRNIHYNLAREKNLKSEIDEYLLKKEGLAEGQLGSMNLANEKKGIMYTSSILGNNLPVATGLALGKKVKSDPGLVIVTTGDGAIEEGAFYESILFMKSHNLPSLIIVENNQWSLGTKIEERRCQIDLQKLASSLSIDYEKLSSNNVFEYIDKLKSIKEKSLYEKTPIILEVELTSLGYLIIKNEKSQEEKFINYHWGGAPEISLHKSPIIAESNIDPLYVLREIIGLSEFNNQLDKIKRELEEQIK